MSTESGASSPGLSVPKGGGATRGLGDGFTPDFNRGTGSYSIEIQVPKGHRDLAPSLALAYNSAAGDGPFGFGWNIALPRIQIDTDAGVADYLAPSFLFGGESLLEMPDGTFRPQVENAFHRIRRVGEGWEITDRSGNVTMYGTTAGSRISGDVAGRVRDFAWLPDLVRDTSGNELRYEYRQDQGNLYLAAIAYAKFEVRFEYEERGDVTVNRRAGFAVATRLRCTAIEVRRPDHAEPRIRRYTLAYAADADAPSMLSTVTMEGFMRLADGSTARSVAPVVRFTYTAFAPHQRRFQVVTSGAIDAPGPLGVNGTELVDLTGDGLPDVVQIAAAGPPRLWRNRGQGSFAPPRTLEDLPTSVGLTGDQVALFDADGEGSADLVYLQEGGAHYYTNAGGGFEPPRYLGGDAPLSLNLADPNTRFADVNGDGRIDLAQTTARGLVTWLNRGGDAGFALPSVSPRTRDRDRSPDVAFSEPGVFFADMTGDGLPDLVHVRSGFVEYWPSLGGGRFDARVRMEAPPVLPRHYDARRIFVADIDGSGPADVVYVGDDRVLIWRNVGGRRFAPPIEVPGVPGTPAASVRLVDLLGQGTAGVLWSDVVTVRGRGYRFLSLAATKPYLLTLVDEGVGLRTRIEYGTSAQHAAGDARAGTPWRTRLPMVVNVVNRIVREDQVTGAEQATEIAYHDGCWDPSVRRFRGFGRVTARRSDAPDAPGSFEEHRYLVGAPDEPGFGADAPAGTDRARRGQGYESAYFSAGPGSPLLRAETTSWQVTSLGQALTGDAILFPQVTSTEVRNIEGGANPRVTATAYSYDQFGNVTEERRRGFAPLGDDLGQPVAPLEAVTRMEYAINADRHIVDRVARTLRLDGGDGVLADVRQYYDGPAAGLPLGQVERGLLSRQEEVTLPLAEADAIYGAGAVDWPALGYHQVTRADGVACWAVNRSRLTHNAAGMMTSRVDARGGTCSYEYDADGLLLTAVTNELGHVARATYDPAWQLIETRTDINGAVTRYAYDPRGRLETVIRPGDSEAFPTLRYTRVEDVLPLSVRTEKRRRGGASDTYEKITYFDGFGRELQTRTRVDGDRVRVTGTAGYNRNGDAVSKGLPLLRQGLAFEPAAALPATPAFAYRYDSVNRVVAAVNLDGREMRVAYTPWTAATSDVIDTDPAHAHRDTPEIRHFDAFGRLAGVSVMSAPGVRHRATYQYDLLGRLVATTDLEGRPALVSATYDARGARLRFVHAAAGLRTMVFDALGRVVSWRDGRGVVVERQHDALGRLVTESVGGEVQERLHWDLTPAQRGLLGRVEDRGGQVTFEYDLQGRIVEKRRQIGGTEYRLGYTYDAAGLQASQIYPDGSEVAIDRWGDARVRALGGFVTEASYDAAGLLTGLRHANGVDETFAYDAAGTLEEMRVAHGAAVLRHARLTHDTAGRLTSNEELAGPHAALETAGFDALGRLVRFTRDRSMHGGSVVAHEYAYDADGNLLRADEMDAPAFEYDFAAPGALRRRRRPDGTFEELEFDEAGQLTQTADLQLTFDARGRLSRIVKTDGTVVEMTYDYRGARLSKRVTGSPGGSYEVRYVDDLYEDHAGIGTAYTYLSGRLVGQRRGSGFRHLHTDHRGNVIVATRAHGQVDARAWMGPYGLGETMSNAEVSRQFGSCVLDGETGLYYFNHRYYSPSLGRFLSPDPRYLAQPERELDLPEAHNLYAYAKGDPIDYVDPTGKGFWSTFGKVLAAIVVVAAVVVAVVVAVAVIAAAMASGGWMIVLGATVLGAIIGGIEGGWEGALMGAMIGFTAGINMSIAGPLGVITFLGVFDGIRSQGWYKSLAGWTSWFMPASWPGHILGLGVFMGNGIAHVFGSDKQIESVKFDWKHGQILTAGGEYGGSPFPWLGIEAAPAHNVGGFSFFTNDLWTRSGESWSGMQDTVEHETGHMLSNAIFGFWQGIVNGIENFTTSDHNDRFFEKIAESNVNESDRASYGREVEVWS